MPGNGWRAHVSNFVSSGGCGLLDETGSCHCVRKTQGFIRQGIVDPADFAKILRLMLERPDVRRTLDVEN